MAVNTGGGDSVAIDDTKWEPIARSAQPAQSTAIDDTKWEPVNDDAGFEAWRKSLPPNLQSADGNYNLRGAYRAGLNPELSDDGTYHLGSRDPKTGLLLKGEGHPTYCKMLDGERQAGYEVYKGDDGQMYSRKSTAVRVGPGAANPLDRNNPMAGYLKAVRDRQVAG